MTLDWEIKLINPLKPLRIHAGKAWERSMPEIDQWMRSELVPAMVYGGHGIVGIAQTDFYKYVTSPRGLSELGIEASEPPKLLKAYATTAFKINVQKKQMNLEFGNYAKLKAATPHPADGTGHLHIDSWLEWVDGKEVDSGFVPRSKLGNRAAKSIRLGEPLGGLMLPRGAYGSTGLWRFPSQLRQYEDKWFKQNIKAIQDLIIDKMISVFVMKLVT
jgi:hypothetical protein